MKNASSFDTWVTETVGDLENFTGTQVDRVKTLLQRSVRESTSKVDLETYLKLCEQLGQEPDPEKMPLDASVFPAEVQVAFFVFGLLPDRWDSMSGCYMGKDWSSARLYILYL